MPTRRSITTAIAAVLTVVLGWVLLGPFSLRGCAGDQPPPVVVVPVLLPDEPLPGESQAAFEHRQLTRRAFEQWAADAGITCAQRSWVLAALADEQRPFRAFELGKTNEALRERLREILGDELARDFERRVGNPTTLWFAHIAGYRRLAD